MVPYTTLGYFLETIQGVLLSRSAQGSEKESLKPSKAARNNNGARCADQRGWRYLVQNVGL